VNFFAIVEDRNQIASVLGDCPAIVYRKEEDIVVVLILIVVGVVVRQALYIASEMN